MKLWNLQHLWNLLTTGELIDQREREREREKEKIRMCSRRDEGKISNLQKIRTLGGKRTFYNFEIATNYEIYKIRVNVSTFLYTL